MPADPALPTATEELAALPREELAARLADAYRLISELSARVERLERRAARDSGTSFGIRSAQSNPDDRDDADYTDDGPCTRPERSRLVKWTTC